MIMNNGKVYFMAICLLISAASCKDLGDKIKDTLTFDCGSTRYFWWNQKCCDGKVYKLLHNWECCGNKYIDKWGKWECEDDKLVPEDRWFNLRNIKKVVTTTAAAAPATTATTTASAAQGEKQKR